ncbi:MAG: hypothetical protein GX455_02365 [Phycisphaerae bacterium]|nr:hypothetical protein [Phycisphaerae bacterium]
MRVIPLKGLIAYGFLCLGLVVASTGAQGINVALGKTATASSVWEAASSPDKVVDGITNLGHPEQFHSGSGDRTPWWQVDLGQVYLIQRIVLWNRVDCCQNRLRDITVQIRGPANEVLFETLVNPGDVLNAPPTITVTPPVTPGQIVRISRTPDEVNLTGDDQYLLQLAEVQVFGLPFLQAFEPTPEDGAIRVGANVADLNQVDVTLSWASALIINPLDPNQVVVDPLLVAHKVYISNPGSTDPNNHYLGEVAAGSPPQSTAQFGPITLNRDATYTWRVDEIRNDGGNLVTVKGSDWVFSTESVKPVILSIAPTLQFAWSVESGASTGRPAESISFIVQAENPYSKDTAGMDIAWFKVNAGGDIKVADGSELSIPEVKDADAGQFYCVVTLTDPGTATTSKSSNVALKIKHIVGYWPFDGDFQDKVGTNHGTPLGTPLPSFTQGIIGQATKFDGLDGAPAQAVRIPTSGLPTSNFTLSFWEKAPNSTRAGYMLASGSPTGYEVLYLWRRENNAYYGNFNGGTGPTGSMGQLNAAFPSQVWHHNVFTYDATSNIYRWYVDGQVQPSQSSATGDHTPPTPFTAWDSVIYLANRRSMNRAYAGLMDDMSYFDYTMEPREIAEFYLKTVGGYFCWNPVANDLNGDCVISIADLALMAADWTNCNLVPATACQ